jgi:hydrogenase nickel incorporation protein HypB
MFTTCGHATHLALMADSAFKPSGKRSARWRCREFDQSPVVHAHPRADDGLDFGAGPAGAHTPGVSQARMVRIERDILAKNNIYAQQNRDYLTEHGIFALNLVSSPGSGKTTLLINTIAALNGDIPLVTFHGDQHTNIDAERIRAAGVPAAQISTGKGSHLDAWMVGRAMDQLTLADNSLLLIENVGDLVCPASFDLGEAHKVVVFSVTEGEDKPLKYPDIFRAASVVLLNKCDLLPHLAFDVELAEAYARQVNPKLEVIRISAADSVQSEGMRAWLAWIREGYQLVAGEK